MGVETPWSTLLRAERGLDAALGPVGKKGCAFGLNSWVLGFSLGGPIGGIPA